MTSPATRDALCERVQERFIAYCSTPHDTDAERLAAGARRDAFAALAYELSEGEKPKREEGDS